MPPALDSFKRASKPPLTFPSKPSKPACTDSAMFLSSAAKADSRLEDSKPVPTPCESLEDLKPASRSPSSQLIHEGMKVKDPHDLYNLVESVHKNAGHKLSELSRTSKGTPFSSTEMKEEFGYESFERGTKTFKCPRRGKLFCVHKGYCPFNVAFSFKIKERAYVILDGPGIEEKQYYTNLCLHHNHDPYSTVLNGVTEVTSSKDLSEEERDLLKNCALLGTRMPSVQHSLSTKFGKLTRIYHSPMLQRFITDEKTRIFGSDHDRIPELMSRGRQLKKNGGEFEVDIDSSMCIIGT